MATSSKPFDGQTIDEDGFAEIWKHIMPDGVLLSSTLAPTKPQTLQVYGDSSGRQVKVRAGEAWVNARKYLQDAEETVTLSANASANPRIDRIVLRLVKASKTVSLAVLEGTPAVTPTAPALTQSSLTYEISLAKVAVASGYTTVAPADVTDERPVGCGTDGGNGALVKLDTQQLSANGKITLQYIPPAFKSLRLSVVVRSIQATSSASLRFRINGDSTAAYSWQTGYANASTSYASQTNGNTDGALGDIPAGTAPANCWGAYDIVFGDCNGNVYKNIISDGGYTLSGNIARYSTYVTYAGTTAGAVAAGINKIELFDNYSTTNLAASSQAILYGVR